MVTNLSLIVALICLVIYLFLSSRREKKTRESLSYYKALFENQAQAVIVIEEDTTISLANKKTEELSGYPREKVLGKMKLGDFLPEGERERILSYHQARRNKNLPPPPNIYEVKFLTKERTARYIQVYANLISGTGKTIAVLNDITQMRKAQQELERARDYVNKLIAYANSPIIVTDAEGKIVLFNQASENLFGYTEREIIGESIKILLPEDKIKDMEEFERRILSGENLKLVETPVLTKKREVRTVLWNSACIFDNGQLRAIIFQGQDITELKKAQDELQKAYELNLRALTTALESREHGTERHCERVARYAEVLAHRIGLDDGYIKDIVRGALLHDIGKIGVRDSILLKPGKLTPQEMEEVKKHPLIGANILKGIDYFARAIEVVLYHHERWDGKGYPFGLSADKIPFSARIFSVVDAFDAMTTDRPYRKKMTVETAREEIKKGAGTQFDPKIVEAFLGTPVEIWHNIRKKLKS
ncbi:PAS domain S-box protein [Candidatus Aerophobetes bacterium]|nr:PAS domain S-box protein [Candidatus Aerophobetes bacterium]